MALVVPGRNLRGGIPEPQEPVDIAVLLLLLGIGRSETLSRWRVRPVTIAADRRGLHLVVGA